MIAPRTHVRLVLLPVTMLIALSACQLFASSSIDGTVRDDTTHQPVSGAKVRVAGMSAVATTSLEGTFLIRRVPAGLVRVTITCPGYEDCTIDSFLVRPDRSMQPGFDIRRSADPRWRTIVGTETDATAADLRCEIIPVKETYHVGDTASFRVVLTNVSKKPVVLVGSIEGSTGGDRYPHCVFTLERDGDTMVKRGIRIDGNFNDLRSSDFRLLAPGRSFEPFAMPSFVPPAEILKPFAKPGHYVVTFSYSTDAIDYKDWQPWWRAARADVIEKLKEVPRLNLQASIAVDVVE